MRSEGGVATAAPVPHHPDVEGPTDHQLVAAVRRGDDRAFETLYHRYTRRIQAYVFGMCKDHARAEDITQEIFVSALRRIRETERPIAFKPWIYEIAKNACIDQHRRSRRTEEVSLQSEDGLAPSDYGRLVNSGPTPDVAVTVKQSLDHLCGAFGGLSDTHHDILVMRELEGLSYREIGERLGMSRPAVESTLFRARRRLTEEYGELASGQRCLRVQGIIATAARGRLGARDATRLSRHVAHCMSCRRDAIAAGLDAATLRKPLRTRAAAKVAALLPLPTLARRFGSRGADDAAASSMPSSWLAHLPLISDHVGAGWTKAFAAVALLLAGVGAGVGTEAASRSGKPAPRAGSAVAHERAVSGGGGGAAAPASLVAPRGDSTRSLTAKAKPHRTATRPATRSGSGTVRSAKSSSGSSATGSSQANHVRTSTSTVRAGATPVATPAATPASSGTGAVQTLSTSTSQTVQQTTSGAVSGATGAVGGATSAVGGTTSAVGGATSAVGSATGGPAGGAVSTVGGTVSGAGQTVGAVDGAVSGALAGAAP